MTVSVRVAAVVVTYNRRRLLLECLDALRVQQRPADAIFVIDNGSTDGTAQALGDYRARHGDTVRVLTLPGNVGGAGGFKAGIAAACDAGFDWVWLMDDDAEPRPGCLSELLRFVDLPDAAVVAPIVVRRDGSLDERVPHRALFKGVWRSTFTSVARTITRAELRDRTHIEIDHVSFVGPCIARAAVAHVGLPLETFFIHCDDTEYSSRLMACGKVYLVANAVILHKEEQAGDATVRRLFGAATPSVRYDRLWLSYYGFRNMVWLISRGRVRAFKVVILLRFAKLILRVLAFEDRKLARLRFWSYALADGLRGHFDNERPRRLTS